jgi:hypothetical protein
VICFFLLKTGISSNIGSGRFKNRKQQTGLFFSCHAELATVLKVHQETKQQMRRLVQGVLAFLSVSLSFAVRNSKETARGQLVRLCDMRAQETFVMSLHGRAKFWIAGCPQVGRNTSLCWKTWTYRIPSGVKVKGTAIPLHSLDRP